MVREVWKKLSYWQKGGLIGGLIYSFVGLATLIMALNCTDEGLGCLSLLAPVYPAYLLLGLIDLSFINNFPDLIATTIAGLSLILAPFLVGFLAGAAIGLIIGKIKRRKIYKHGEK